MSLEVLTGTRSDQGYWDRRYAEWWDRPFHGMTQEPLAVMTREEARFAAELAAILQPDHIVLDAGCGYGRLAPIICPLVREYVGVDFAAQAIKEAGRTAPCNASFLTCDLLALDLLDFGHEPFDVIVAVGLERTPELLDHLRSMLKPDGVIYP